jgi:hypothetical protein
LGDWEFWALVEVVGLRRDDWELEFGVWVLIWMDKAVAKRVGWRHARWITQVWTQWHGDAGATDGGAGGVGVGPGA